MKVEIISERVHILGAPGEVVELDPTEINVDALIEGGHVKTHKTPTKKDKE